MIAATVLTLSSTISCAQTIQDLEAEAAKLPALKASIYGTQLTGARELGAALAGKSDAQGQPIFEAATRPVRIGESFQMTVEMVRPGGARQDVTADPRTKYAGTGCLLTSTSGFITVAQDVGPCRPGMVTELWVSMVDQQNRSQAWNRYVFKIVE